MARPAHHHRRRLERKTRFVSPYDTLCILLGGLGLMVSFGLKLAARDRERRGRCEARRRLRQASSAFDRRAAADDAVAYSAR